jgi:hypothetical protein
LTSHNLKSTYEQETERGQKSRYRYVDSPCSSHLHNHSLYNRVMPRIAAMILIVLIYPILWVMMKTEDVPKGEDYD